MYEDLDKLWQKKLFPHAWNICCENIPAATSYINGFISKILKSFSSTDLGTSFDYKYIGLEKNSEGDSSKVIKVEQIRSMIDFLQKTSNSPFKFVVIENAQCMNEIAANSCLKIVEEPPLGSYIFFVTPIINDLPITIKSRCRKLHFGHQPSEVTENPIIFNNVLGFLQTENVKYLENLFAAINKDKENSMQLLFNLCLKMLHLKCKIVSGITCSIPKDLNEILYAKGAGKNIYQIIDAYEYVEKLAFSTQEQDLDARQIALLTLTKTVQFL